MVKASADVRYWSLFHRPDKRHSLQVSGGNAGRYDSQCGISGAQVIVATYPRNRGGLRSWYGITVEP